jgi:hypothetical protein
MNHVDVERRIRRAIQHLRDPADQRRIDVVLGQYLEDLTISDDSTHELPVWSSMTFCSASRLSEGVSVGIIDEHAGPSAGVPMLRGGLV